MHAGIWTYGRRLAAGSLGLLLAFALSPLFAWAGARPNPTPTGSVTLAPVSVGSTVTAGTDVLLRATLVGIPNPKRARFYDGNAMIDVARGAPWETQVRKIKAGTHDYRVDVISFSRVPVHSATVTIVAVAGPVNQPPTVSILTPASNATIAPGAAVDFTADAKDADGSVARVEYWKGSTLLGTATAAPFKVTYTAATLGKVTIVAKAYDNAGATSTSAAVSFTVANHPPTVSILTPAGNALIAQGTVVDFTADASDPDGSVARVEYWKGSTLIGTATAAPFKVTYTAATLGKVTIVAKAYDNAGASTTSAAVSFTVANQSPTVSILTPAGNATVALGTAVSLTAAAADADGSVAKVEYWKGSTLLGTATAAPYAVSYTPAALGSVTVVAKAFDNTGANTTSVAVTFAVVVPPPVPIAADDGVRLLLQATFGPTAADVARVRQLGISGWLDEQFALPLTYSHLQYLRDVKTLTGKDAGEEHAYEAVWQNFLFGADQLRARVAFALSEIVVISNIAPDQDTWALASWMDMLYRNAFGNYRTLLDEATLHPAMGYYLNMLGNDKENAAKGFRPNENYARELLQLFSIGLVKLNADGTPAKDAQGRTTATYDQPVVEGFAQAFTGWNFAGNDTTSNSAFYWPKENWIEPMVAWPKRHSPGTKLLLDGRVLPAGQTPQQDLKDALDNVFGHPNVGPFVARRLIQFLVTSNPSPAYVGRVAAKFNDNGAGVRGDLKAVVRATLTDPEARDLNLASSPTFGKLREPVIRFTHLMRATHAVAANGRNSVWWLDSPEDGLGQSPLLAPSVFNFFSPFFARPGTIAQAGLVSPEFQIHTETQVVGNANFFANIMWNRAFGFKDAGKLKMDLTAWTTLAASPTALVDEINLVFAANTLSLSTRASMANAVATVPSSKATERVRVALTLLMVSPDFVVQH